MMNRPQCTSARASPRLEAGDKATGARSYADDLACPACCMPRCTPARTRMREIVGYRLDAARAMPGVKAIVTGADLSGARAGGDHQGRDRWSRAARCATSASRWRLSRRVDRGNRRSGGALIEVEYEPLPAVLSIDAALAPDAPILHEEFAIVRQDDATAAATATSCSRSAVVEGDVDRAFANATSSSRAPGRRRRSITSTWSRTAVVADVDAAGRITLHVTCQSVHHVQQRVAEELGEPMAKIRAIATRVGGAVSAASMRPTSIRSPRGSRARRAQPVKLVLSRMQDFEIQRSRHPARIWMRTGARRDGTILARDVRITIDGGAYADESPPVLAFCAADVARSLPHSQRAGARPGRLHQQAARRLVPRLRQSAGDVRGRVADRRAGARSSASIRSSCACATRCAPDDTAFGGQRRALVRADRNA